MKLAPSLTLVGWAALSSGTGVDARLGGSTVGIPSFGTVSRWYLFLDPDSFVYVGTAVCLVLVCVGNLCVASLLAGGARFG